MSVIPPLDFEAVKLISFICSFSPVNNKSRYGENQIWFGICFSFLYKYADRKEDVKTAAKILYFKI